MALGSTCFHMMRAFESPKARAAFTYSKFRARRNSARTRWTRFTQENKSRMPSSTRNDGVITAATMMRM